MGLVLVGVCLMSAFYLVLGFFGFWIACCGFGVNCLFVFDWLVAWWVVWVCVAGEWVC